MGSWNEDSPARAVDNTGALGSDIDDPLPRPRQRQSGKIASVALGAEDQRDLAHLLDGPNDLGPDAETVEQRARSVPRLDCKPAGVHAFPIGEEVDSERPAQRPLLLRLVDNAIVGEPIAIGMVGGETGPARQRIVDESAIDRDDDGKAANDRPGDPAVIAEPSDLGIPTCEVSDC